MGMECAAAPQRAAGEGEGGGAGFWPWQRRAAGCSRGVSGWAHLLPLCKRVLEGSSQAEQERWRSRNWYAHQGRKDQQGLELGRTVMGEIEDGVFYSLSGLIFATGVAM